jgi:hypothetical protein
VPRTDTLLRAPDVHPRPYFTKSCPIVNGDRRIAIGKQKNHGVNDCQVAVWHPAICHNYRKLPNPALRMSQKGRCGSNVALSCGETCVWVQYLRFVANSRTKGSWQIDLQKAGAHIFSIRRGCRQNPWTDGRRERIKVSVVCGGRLWEIRFPGQAALCEVVLLQPQQLVKHAQIGSMRWSFYRTKLKNVPPSFRQTRVLAMR